MTASCDPVNAAVYQYRDLDGHVAYEVARGVGRDGGKTFTQRVPNNNGGGPTYNLDGVVRIPYRLPELIEAGDKGAIVWIVEGEKDADRLADLGFVATTNPGGAGKYWTAEWAEYFRGFERIYVLPDNDDPGRRHAQKVASVVATVVDDVRLVTLHGLDVKGDISDWLDLGNDADTLWKIAEAAPSWKPPKLKDSPAGDEEGDDESWQPIDLGPAWRDEKPRPEATVFQRDDGLALLLPGINYLFGDSGDGKSFVTLIAVVAEIKAGIPAIWVTYEDADEVLIVGRLKLLGVTEDEAMLVHFIAPQTGLTHGAQQIANLAANIGAHLVVLDSVGEAMAVGGVDENLDREVGPWFRQTLRLIHNLDPALSILPIDHSTKAKDNPLFPSGSKRKRAAPTGRMYLLNVRQPFAIGAVGYVQLVVAKDRGGTFKRGAIAAEIKLDATTTPYTFAVTVGRDGDSYQPKVSRRNAAERVLEVLGEALVPVTAEEITRMANGPDRIRPGEGGLSIGTVKNALTTMSKKGPVSPITTPPNEPGRFPSVKWHCSHHDSDESKPS